MSTRFEQTADHEASHVAMARTLDLRIDVATVISDAGPHGPTLGQPRARQRPERLMLTRDFQRIKVTVGHLLEQRHYLDDVDLLLALAVAERTDRP
jgi:hypothetical protein